MAVDEQYELIAATGSIDDVVELIERTFTEEGRLVPVEEAAQAIEDYLAEEAYKLSKLKKIQQKLAPSAQAKPEQKQTEQPKQPQTQMKTLTNAVGTQRQLSARERAIAAFEGKNK